MVEIKTLEERIEDLLKLGKKEGVITFEQLADTLKGLDIDNDSLDNLYNVLVENNISVVSGDESEDSNGGVGKGEDVVIL